LSNVSNAKASQARGIKLQHYNLIALQAPLPVILPLAQDSGVYTLLDAAALAPTSHISLRETPVDAMAVSFYKMFGYPTGIGALIAKRTFLRDVLKRPWFAVSSGGHAEVSPDIEHPAGRHC
jgi:molybdenum cofactor sulfurtransferase